MDANTVWLAIVVLVICIGVLAVSLIRLRLELWANRRVITALEQMAPQAARTPSSKWPALLFWIGLGLILTQIVLIFRLF
jgi:hypothetical protein